MTNHGFEIHRVIDFLALTEEVVENAEALHAVEFVTRR